MGGGRNGNRVACTLRRFNIIITIYLKKMKKKLWVDEENDGV